LLLIEVRLPLVKPLGHTPTSTSDNKLTVHILAAVAQHEREMIFERTRSALQAAKARGKKLGSPKVREAGILGNVVIQDTAKTGPTFRCGLSLAGAQCPRGRLFLNFKNNATMLHDSSPLCAKHTTGAGTLDCRAGWGCLE
jgi:hypothetical protein